MTKFFRFKTVTATVGIVAVSFAYSLPSVAGKLDLPSTPLSSQNNTPTSGKLIKLTRGDLMCYVDLIVRGKKHHIGADFAICDRTRLIDKQVRLTYKQIQIGNCKSNELCGKNSLKKAIVKMKLVDRK